MNYCTIKNKERINLSDIPIIDIKDLRNQLSVSNLRPVGFFGSDFTDKIKIIAVLADDEKGEFIVSSTLINKNVKEYDSITKENPMYHMFERELYEQFGIMPKGHPWLKPVRKNQDEYKFFDMAGEQIHQVAVGPIHAGVIEPGHFRFLCEGERVYNLEIMLGYQHRGVEDLMTQTPSNQLAESICGDSAIAYNIAYSELIESLTEIKITDKAKIIRIIALEMERIAVHIGDMGAILGDIAYLMGKEVFGTTRTLVINTMLEISGSRFGRGLITVGGTNYDINTELSKKIKNVLKTVKFNVKNMAEAALKSSSVMSRLEKTGIVSKETAEALNMVGMIARSCGLNRDIRTDFEKEQFKELKKTPFKATNDAYSRFNIRYVETLDSISFIFKLLEELKKYSNEEYKTDINRNFIPNSFAISTVEGWRGEIVHIALTDEQGNISRYKIKDPSFNNWFGLSIALRENGISDFPLCNKGFDLSYCGFDL